ncbi:MAG: DUF2911 domain-containing protein [Gemmatimonadota bacterium]|nr:DUF2911 domain-containing protein [Gemmatimonadota bacterium]
MPGLSRSMLGVVLLLILGACGPDEARVEAIETVTPSGAERRSQPARVVQRMGSTEITIVYNRPVARGRELFGGIVPWDSLWNPGADEATRLVLSEDITIAGQPLAAGRYSIWATPGRDEWTLAFNRAWDVDHLTYREANDALRLRVRPHPTRHMESLAFYFPYAEVDSAMLALHWGETMLRLPVRRP